MRPPKASRLPLNSAFFKENRYLIKAIGDFPPRTCQDACLLCLNRMAVQTNSHIFPDFITRTIFKDVAKRRLYTHSEGELRGSKPSAPKDNFIFCQSCEGRLGALERLIALEFPRAIELIRKIPVAPGEDIQILRIHPALFHLFVYSLLWRAHISQSRAFEWLVLTEEHAEELRYMLNNCLSTKKPVMIAEMMSMYPSRLPLDYQVATANQMPMGQFKIIVANGHDYFSWPGYYLHISDLFIVFRAPDEQAHQKPMLGAKYGADVSVLSIKEWETLVDNTKLFMVERARTLNR